jgi:predicted amidohydrolase YtcJ
MLALTNARVFSGVGGALSGRALLVADGRVQEISGAARPRWDAPAIDLQGRTVLPGWRDAHVHLLSYARQRDELVFDGHETFEQVLAAVRGRATGLAPEAWVLGRGWDQNTWGGRALHRRELDAAAGQRPVLLTHKDGHVSWASSAALKRAGVDAASADPPGGRVVRDLSGEPTGLLLETARALMRDVAPEPEARALPGLLRDALAAAARNGLCAVANIGTPAEFAALQSLELAGDLPIRVSHFHYHEALAGLLTLGLRSGFGNAFLRLGGIKVFVDGSLGSQTAWMEQPFAVAGGTGIVRTEPATLARLVREANAGQLAVAVHAIGDRAVRTALDAFAAAADVREALWRTPGRNRVEHIQLARAEDFPRFRALGVVASMQPRHATADAVVAEREWGARCARAYAWADLQRAGATLAFGSDAPVETLAPLVGIHAAVTRRGPDGGPAWHPEQRLSLEDALRAYTVGAAAASADPEATGTLQPGAPADFVVLSGDPFALPASELLSLRVEATGVGGRWAFRAPGFPPDR